jgi:DUF1365 family protein
MSVPKSARFLSGLYECTVMHHRLYPKRHRFEYPVFFFYLDLDELAALDHRLRLFSRGRFNIYSFNDSDHFGKSGDVKASALAFLSRHGVDATSVEKVFLLTFPRVFGYVFNPVSFYFATASDGRVLGAIAEVTNTYREQKAYFVPVSSHDGRRFRRVVAKHFYVSPFTKLDVSFDFRLELPGDSLELHVDDVEADGRRSLVSTVRGRRTELSTARLVWNTFKFPLVTVKVIALIHWNALLLWWKKVPYHRKADDPHLQTGILTPNGPVAR